MLFAKLVKELLGINVIAFEYEDHINIGVNYTPVNKRDITIRIFEGKSYLLCEPTGIGFKLGNAARSSMEGAYKVIPLYTD